ncbi:guanylate kinase-like protein 1 [Sarcoptes scabiei]|nr:guanylate kinase-like protein 1 [Sarcoptes scabiei]
MDGVKNLKKTNLNPRFVFIKPPNLEALEERLRGRGTETEESLRRRLDRAIDELRFGQIEGMFDLIITNDDIDQAYSILREFVVEDVEALKKSRGM